MQEIWKVVDEFPKYSVSNFGRIMNNTNGYILVGGYDRDGYKQVTFSTEEKQFNRRICRLVAKAFIPNPDNLPQVNHKDECKDNDFVENLEWCTAEYNVNYGDRNDKTRRRVKCIETGKIFNGMRVAARAFGISHSNIRKSCMTGGKSAGYHWQYV